MHSYHWRIFSCESLPTTLMVSDPQLLAVFVPAFVSAHFPALVLAHCSMAMALALLSSPTLGPSLIPWHHSLSPWFLIATACSPLPLSITQGHHRKHEINKFYHAVDPSYNIEGSPMQHHVLHGGNSSKGGSYFRWVCHSSSFGQWQLDGHLPSISFTFDATNKIKRFSLVTVSIFSDTEELFYFW